MTTNNRIQLYSQLFQAISLYLEVDFQICKNKMLDYLMENHPNMKKRKGESEERVTNWWDGWQTLQQTTLEKYIEPFFSELANEQGKEWKAEWVTTPLKELELDNEALNNAAKKILQPIVNARLFNEFYQGKADLLSIIEEKYCHQYFYIYRMHSKGKIYVRDLLRIQKHDGLGNIFCNLYQYTEHDFVGQRYKGIRVYSGNVLFNSVILDINLSSNVWDMDHGLRFCKIIFPRLKENIIRRGVMTALSDHGDSPSSTVIAITRAKIKHPINEDEIKNYVKRFSMDEEGQHREIFSNIGDQYIEVTNQHIDIKKPQS